MRITILSEDIDTRQIWKSMMTCIDFAQFGLILILEKNWYMKQVEVDQVSIVLNISDKYIVSPPTIWKLCLRLEISWTVNQGGGFWNMFCHCIKN